MQTPVVHRWPAKRPCVQPAAAAGSRCHGNRISDAVTCNTDTPVAADRHADAQRTIPRRPAGRAGLSPTCGLARRSATLVAEAGAVVDLSPSTSSRSSEHQHRCRSPHHDRIDISLRMNEFRHFLLSLTFQRKHAVSVFVTKCNSMPARTYAISVRVFAASCVVNTMFLRSS